MRKYSKKSSLFLRKNLNKINDLQASEKSNKINNLALVFFGYL